MGDGLARMQQSDPKASEHDDFVDAPQKSTRRQDHLALSKLQGTIISGHDGRINLQFQAKKDRAASFTGPHKIQLIN